MEGGAGDRQGVAGRDPRELCPLDLSALTPGRLPHTNVVFVVVLLAAWGASELVTPGPVGFGLVYLAAAMIALWRAVRVADSVSVFHRAVDDGWLQAQCTLRGSGQRGLSAQPAVLTISHGRLALVGEIAEEWPTTEVELQPPPKRWSGGSLTIATPSGPRRLTFIASSDFGAVFSAIVDRQVRTAVGRALSSNRPPPWQ